MNGENQPQITPPQIPKPESVTSTGEKALRTYESDIADVLAHKNISTASIAMAEKKRQTGSDSLGSSTDSNSGYIDRTDLAKKILVIVSIIILLGGGVGIGYYLYTQSPLGTQTNPQPVAPVIATLIPTDTRVGIATDGLTTSKIVEAVRSEISKPQTPNSIKEIVLTRTDSSTGQKFGISSIDVIKALGLSSPDVFNRSISNEWMLGVYSNNQNEKSIFVVLSVDYFQNAFAGMLQWEKDMVADIKQYTTVNNATNGSFIDRIIRNKDVREFVTNDNNIVLLYSFVDNTKLVITSSESALSEILIRLEQKAFVR